MTQLRILAAIRSTLKELLRSVHSPGSTEEHGADRDRILLNKPPAIVSHYALTMSRGNEAVQEWEEVVVLDPAQGVALPAPGMHALRAIFRFC